VNTIDTRIAAARVREFYERLQPGDLERLDAVYAPHAYFRDPFNEVRGLDEVRRIFAHMFEQLDDCRFVVLDTVVDAGGAMLTWDMTFRIRRFKPAELRTIHGATHLRFDATGRIAYHRDYWDAAEELYAKLPLVGPMMRWLRKRLG
jgi:steroid delta-isomerase